MKDISIELEEAGLDPFDNSNLNRYFGDTHHFGEEIIKSPVNINEQYGAYGTESVKLELQGTNVQLDAKFNEKFQKIVDERYEQKVSSKLVFVDGDQLNRFGIDLASGPDLTSLGLVTKNDDGSLNLDMESGGLFSRHTIVNGRQVGKSFMRQQLGRALHQRYRYSCRLAEGHLHYDVIDRHTREVVNTYRQIKKAKALVKELNRE